MPTQGHFVPALVEFHVLSYTVYIQKGRRYFNAMKEELKSAFFSRYFLMAFGLMLTCFLGYSLPSWIFSADWGDEFREGALQQDDAR